MQSIPPPMRYTNFSHYLKQKFTERVKKIPLDAGLTCPNRDGTHGYGGCIYCDTHGSGRSDSKPIAEQIKAYLHRHATCHKFIAYFQSFSNTYASVDRLKKLWESIYAFPEIIGIAVGTRADCLTKENLELLATFSNRYEVWLELGLQSKHDETLMYINRGHTLTAFMDGYTLARNYPLKICIHIIYGIPNESDIQMKETGTFAAQLKPDGIKFHNFYIPRGSPIAAVYVKKPFPLITQDRYIQHVCDTLEILHPECIIQRLTGEAQYGELIAPLWAHNKSATIEGIRTELQQRGTRQGIYCS